MRPFESRQLHAALGQLRRRLLLRAGLRSLSVAFLAAALSMILGLPASRAAGFALLAGTLAALIQYVVARDRWPTLMSLVEHLNRAFPLFEESAQLLLSGSRATGAVKDIQRRRVEAAWELCIERREDWLPLLKVRTPLLLICGSLLAMILSGPLNEWWHQAVANPPTPEDQAKDSPSPQLVSARIRVTPPAYTGQPESFSDRPDVALVQDSRIEWALEFNRAGRYQLELSDGETLDLEAGEDGRYRASAIIERNQLYRVYALVEGGKPRLVDVHSLSVTLDRAPDARVLEPSITTLEIPSLGPARFESQVEVSDDYGVDRAEIRASVAKGSGEGVKFRDAVLAFDSHTIRDDRLIYHRFWDLEQLGMEPGDELYFFVYAFDNRLPQANRGRSETVVVRWLEETTAPTSAEGIAVDVMPDYFKSQRQIIIETEELIADRRRLDQDTFDALSRGLGQDQGSLKLRYGQYLGDEAEGFGLAPAMAEIETGNEDTDDHDHEHEAVSHEGHEHDSGTPGSAETLIEQFTHDHEAAEIGPVTARNPVGLMKRALGSMWQAELQLLLSEPDRALPFERDALKYLNLARQAERIYTERLGFEPPPVTEDRRLSGDLDSIRVYVRSDQGHPPDDDDALFRMAFELLSGEARPDDEALSRLEDVSLRLAALAQERPILLEQAATLERWMASFESQSDCSDCREELLRLFWSLIGQPEPQPEPGARTLAVDDPMIRDYRQALLQSETDPEGGSR